MKLKLWLLAWVAAVLLSAGPVLADDGFYVIAGGGKAGTPINSVPATISSPGMYYLNGYLTSTPTNQNGITINASDVTLDLMGFTLTGPGKTSGSSNSGIQINSSTNVEIRNGSVINFGYNGIGGSGTAIRVIGLRAR